MGTATMSRNLTTYVQTDSAVCVCVCVLTPPCLLGTGGTAPIPPELGIGGRVSEGCLPRGACGRGPGGVVSVTCLLRWEGAGGKGGACSLLGVGLVSCLVALRFVGIGALVGAVVRPLDPVSS